ncbi:Uncharacterised protein [Pandoraea pulmonicola]|uniref:Uncharacterized protein n=1 Tax=Pandoraea pulmonicola TaxID=93221 RepID=A0AAJ4ZHS0_PANPU|nr:Uncharacterised protein [Pandoraea pulmonicola]
MMSSKKYLREMRHENRLEDWASAFTAVQTPVHSRATAEVI